MEKLTLMMIVPNRARADISLNATRIYYRFATESTEDDGDLPGLKDRFTVVAERLLDAMKAREGEKPIDPQDLKVTVFVDNVMRSTKDMTEEALKRIIDQLLYIDDAFSFLQGFTA